MSAFEDDCIQSVGQWNRLQAPARRGGGEMMELALWEMSPFLMHSALGRRVHLNCHSLRLQVKASTAGGVILSNKIGPFTPVHLVF